MVVAVAPADVVGLEPLELALVPLVVRLCVRLELSWAAVIVIVIVTIIVISAILINYQVPVDLEGAGREVLVGVEAAVEVVGRPAVEHVAVPILV